MNKSTIEKRLGPCGWFGIFEHSRDDAKELLYINLIKLKNEIKEKENDRKMFIEDLEKSGFTLFEIKNSFGFKLYRNQIEKLKKRQRFTYNFARDIDEYSKYFNDKYCK